MNDEPVASSPRNTNANGPGGSTNPLVQSPFDLAAKFHGYDVKIERSETQEERRVRLAGIRRRDLITDYLWVILVLFLIVVAAISISVAVFDSHAGVADKEWAQKLVTPLVSGVIAFVLGRASAK